MASSFISAVAEDRLEGASTFNVWEIWVMNILQEHDLDQYVTLVWKNPPQMQGEQPSGRTKPRLSKSFFTQSKIASCQP